MTICLGNLVCRRVFREHLSVCVCASFLFGFEGGGGAWKEIT